MELDYGEWVLSYGIEVSRLHHSMYHPCYCVHMWRWNFLRVGHILVTLTLIHMALEFSVCSRGPDTFSGCAKGFGGQSMRVGHGWIRTHVALVSTGVCTVES